MLQTFKIFQMLDKILREAKWWGETFVGLGKVIVSPKAPIPPGFVHPRQPAIASTPAEGVRFLTNC